MPDNETKVIEKLTEIIRIQADEISRLEHQLNHGQSVESRLLALEIWQNQIESVWQEVNNGTR